MNIAFIDHNVRTENHKGGKQVPIHRVHVYPLSKKDRLEIEERKKKLKAEGII